MYHLLNVVTAFSIILLAIVLASLRRAHIRVEYSVSWLAAAATLLLLSRSRTLLEWLSRALGVSDLPTALIMIVACVFLAVFYRFTVILSHLKDANIAMAQRIAILQFQVEALNEKRQTIGPSE